MWEYWKDVCSQVSLWVDNGYPLCQPVCLLPVSTSCLIWMWNPCGTSWFYCIGDASLEVPQQSNNTGNLNMLLYLVVCTLNCWWMMVPRRRTPWITFNTPGSFWGVMAHYSLMMRIICVWVIRHVWCQIQLLPGVKSLWWRRLRCRFQFTAPAG